MYNFIDFNLGRREIKFSSLCEKIVDFYPISCKKRTILRSKLALLMSCCFFSLTSFLPSLKILAHDFKSQFLDIEILKNNFIILHMICTFRIIGKWLHPILIIFFNSRRQNLSIRTHFWILEPPFVLTCAKCMIYFKNAKSFEFATLKPQVDFQTKLKPK